MSYFTLLQITQSQRSDPDSDQTQYLDLKPVEDSSDLAILTFIQHDFDPTVLLAAAQKCSMLDAQDTIRSFDSGGH